MVGNPGRHCRCDSQALVNPRKIIVHKVDRNRRCVILNFLGKCIGQSAHGHSHGEILPLNITGGNVPWIGVADNPLALTTVSADALHLPASPGFLIS